ncbi:MAG TPA: lipid-binding SYLF domain-containing protein [Vicinamibacterales bacterium]|nr:lipid-binding SYLF domain-containing protein [Vicinamibacterales bacterium]
MRKLVIAGVTLLASSVAVSAAVSRAEEKRLQEAASVLHELHETPDKDIPRDLWDKASCVVVIPSVKKAAFIVGGEYGKGVMSCRTGTPATSWTPPAFMMLAKGSVGFQIGGEAVDLVLLVMNDHGMKHLLQDKVALGGEASIAGGPVGRDARAMTDAQLKAEILSYSRSQGLFAGIDLTGGVLKPDTDSNEDVYGRNIHTADIIERRAVTAPPQADVFMRALQREPVKTFN